MLNVTVIFTRHDDMGNCNSVELLKIINSIQPEVIFEELLPSVFDQIYLYQNRTTLESNTVKLYLLTNDVEHIPIDTFVCPEDYYIKKSHLLDVIGKHLYNSVGLNTAFKRHVHHVEMDGFIFLNCDLNDVLMDDLSEQENQILAAMEDDNLNQINRLRVEVHSMREDEIIENIYKYTSQNTFNTGILFIGAGHRKSIKTKIASYATQEGSRINWHFLTTRNYILQNENFFILS
jgi:hypothetical protein